MTITTTHILAEDGYHMITPTAKVDGKFTALHQEKIIAWLIQSDTTHPLSPTVHVTPITINGAGIFETSPFNFYAIGDQYRKIRLPDSLQELTPDAFLEIVNSIQKVAP